MGAVKAARPRVRASIHIDLAPDMRPAFINDEDTLFRGKLDDLCRVRRRKHARAARRSAHAFRIVFGFIHRMIVVDSSSPWFEGDPRLGRSSATLTAATA